MSGAIIKAIKASGIPLRGNDIDTDRIIPARFLKCVTFDGLGAHAFEDDILDLEKKGLKHPFKDDTYKGAGILVSNSNFGCGSSREHAPQSLKRWGISAIIAESYSEIFYGNCVSMGIPCFRASAETANKIQSYIEANPKAELTLSVEAKSITLGSETVALEMPEGPWKQFLDGSWNPRFELVSRLEQVKSLAAGLPYVHGFA